jgi:hypothetical protein
MPLRRKIDWTTAMRDLRAERDVSRPAVNAMQLHFQKVREIELGKMRALSAPLTIASGFDRAAIMRLAVAEARTIRFRSPATSWACAMRSGLPFAWGRAKTLRLLAARAA